MPCVICTEKIEDDDAKFLPCFHKFHRECIHAWITQNPSCPVCRFKLDKVESGTRQGAVIFDPSRIV
jgi:hypothetical protein